jgi:hypothetical protein
MRPHIIELERIDGMGDEGIQLEIQGAMSVMLDPSPLEGVYESKLRMSPQTAMKLIVWLDDALRRRGFDATKFRSPQ